MTKLLSDDPGWPFLKQLLEDGQLKPNMELPPDADPILLERVKVCRELHEAYHRGRPIEELTLIGDRLLQLCAAPSASGSA